MVNVLHLPLRDCMGILTFHCHVALVAFTATFCLKIIPLVTSLFNGSIALLRRAVFDLFSCFVYLHTASKELWRVRETRVLYALGNCLFNAKVSHALLLMCHRIFVSVNCICILSVVLTFAILQHQIHVDMERDGPSIRQFVIVRRADAEEEKQIPKARRKMLEYYSSSSHQMAIILRLFIGYNHSELTIMV